MAEIESDILSYSLDLDDRLSARDFLDFLPLITVDAHLFWPGLEHLLLTIATKAKQQGRVEGHGWALAWHNTNNLQHKDDPNDPDIANNVFRQALIAYELERPNGRRESQLDAETLRTIDSVAARFESVFASIPSLEILTREVTGQDPSPTEE